MGVDAADFDGDGWQDLFVANVDQEMFSLYKNNKDETFNDVPTGIGDNDGNLDVLPCNGHPDDKIEERYSQVKYKEPLLLP